MPPFQSRAQQAPSEEMPEFPIVGPFGGLQSELPLDQIEDYGFADTTNVLFRKGTAQLRPGITVLPPFPAPAVEPVLGIADFFNANGNRIQTVLTDTRLLQWNASSSDWTVITGPPFTGTPTQTWAWDVVGEKLCFSQGSDTIFIWDGISGSYTQTSGTFSGAANFIAEIGLHLMGQNVVQGGVGMQQTYIWSGIGDPSDWSSFSAGQNNLLNNLGPGRGILKLGQYGYGWHNWGIIQIQPTGIAAAPFYFTAIANSNVGNICPRSLARFNKDGVECAAFVGKDNVYVFNQSSVIPIGDQPIDGRRRLGARSRIFADLVLSNIGTAFGFVTQNITGQILNAYWLLIPDVAMWLYNFDEGNWTRFTYQEVQLVLGLFFLQKGIRIEDLIGTIMSQTWTPATLNPVPLFDGFAFGYDNGQVAYVDFTKFSEVNGQVLSGKHIFHDRRHSHTVKKFRLVVQDNGPATYTVTVANNLGYSETQVVTLGTGSGDSLTVILTFNVTGLRIQWTCAFEALDPCTVIEFTPMYINAGEQRGGNVD